MLSAEWSDGVISHTAPRKFGTSAEVSARHSAQVPKCPDTSAPVKWCRNVLGPKCPGSDVS